MGRMGDCQIYDWAFLASTYGGSGLFRAAVPFGEVIDRCRGRLTYLATPYSKIAVDLDGHFCHMNSGDAARAAANWVTHCGISGVTAISPIVQSVVMINSKFGHDMDPLDDAFWGRWCGPLLKACGAVVIPPIDGWDSSVGVWLEARNALKSNKPVFVIKKGSEYGGGV